jgi:transcriptional regulator with XRE-family HTH domain
VKPNYHLKRERELLGWSQARLAQEIGTDPPTVSRWERGISTPTPYFREKLCTLFGTNASALGLLTDTNVKKNGDQTPQANDLPRDSEKTAITQPVSSPRIFDLATPSLPAILRLVGRDHLLQHIKARLFHAQQENLLVFSGLPGVGKTALATILAHDHEIQEHFPDGILWAGLGPEPNVDSLLGRWGNLLGLPVSARPNLEEYAHAIHEAIGTRRMLLIIDDAWDIQDALNLKVGGPHCAHLVTTRMPRVALHFLPGEIVPIPELDEQASLSLLAAYVPDLLNADAQTAQHLITTVGGLPLALTLIGKYLRIHAWSGHPRRLEDAIRHVSETQQRLYMSEPRALIDTHPSLSRGTPLSLHSIIAVSEQHIEERGQKALHELALFPPKPNSFSEEAALAVSQVPAQILDDLSDAGLLECPEPGRYMLHCTIADYARMKIEDAEAIQRFVTYMVRYVEENRDDYNLLEQESRNILKALDEAFTHQITCEFVRGVVALVAFLLARALYELADTYLRKAYTIARAQAGNEHILELLLRLGQSSWDQNKSKEAEIYFQEGLAFARKYANDPYTCTFLMNLCEIAEKRGDLEQAQSYGQEGQALVYRLRHRDRTFFHRVATEPESEEMYVFFTEPPAMIQRGLLADVETIFRSWKYADCIVPEALQHLTGPDAHRYGFPSEAYVLCLVYNRRLFAEAGLDPDQPPRTWDEFRTAAKQLTRPDKHLFGFAESTIHHQGGWHFTNWLYSGGVQVETYQDGRWLATFADDRAVQLLEMFREMRFTDGSIPHQTLLNENDIIMMLSQGRIAMAIEQDAVLQHLYRHNPRQFADFGLAPMPQNGGNACLLGGNAYVFYHTTPIQTIQRAFKEISKRHFDFENYEAHVRAAAREGRPVGLPLTPLIVGPLRQQLLAINAAYCNVPQQNYKRYQENTLKLVPEPAFEAQKYYALADTLMQKAFTDPSVNLRQLLELSARYFQQRVLKTDS